MDIKKLFGRKRDEHRVGLALSGGGARGFAHAGALQALEETGLRPDVIAGVSAGSVITVLYAAGLEPKKMVEIFSQSKFSDFAEMKMPKEGLFSIERFGDFLQEHLNGYTRLEDLPMKTYVCATNFETGEPVRWDSGSIVERVLASCCIPIVFRPVVIDGVRYVDGGVVHNLPAWAIRDKCKYLIGVNCSPLSRKEPGTSLPAIALRSYELMAKSNSYPDMDLCDILIRTDEIASYKVFDLSQISNVFDSGYRDTMNYLLYHGFRRVRRL